jgi:hypothetical protein
MILFIAQRPFFGTPLWSTHDTMVSKLEGQRMLNGLVKVVGVEWYGDGAIKVVYEDGGERGVAMALAVEGWTSKGL